VLQVPALPSRELRILLVAQKTSLTMEKVENILHHHKKDDGQTDEQVQDQSSTMTGQGETEKKSKGLFGIGVGNPFPHVCLEGSVSTQIHSPGTCRARLKFAKVLLLHVKIV
jgi:hypothetical protein